jgi:hypothetical protein
MLKRLYIVFLAAAGSFLLIQCSEKTDPQLEVDKFTSIIDVNKFDAAYHPIDIQQTTDGGYVVLSERKITGGDPNDPQPDGIYLLKLDKHGNFEKEYEVTDSLTNPICRLAKIDAKFYFFCMGNRVFGEPTAKLASFTTALSDFSTTNIDGLTYPGGASLVGPDKFVLLSYNNSEKKSYLSLISPDGVQGASRGFTVGVGLDSEKEILKHYLRTGREFPFDAGLVSGNTYYFNGFYEYTMSLVFTDLNSDTPIGVVNGQQGDGGFSAVAPLGSARFAAARYNFGANFFLPNPAIQINGVSTGVDLDGLTLPELIPNAKVKILPVTVRDKKVLVYASDTQSRQIGLYFYDEATGVFLGSRYLGFSNPFEIGNLIQTEDDGLAVCGTTYLVGRFPRVCVFKLSKQDLEGSVKVQ